MHLALPILAAFVLLCFSTGAFAQAVTPYQVKAAFLYNFIKFIEWPKEAFHNADSPYVVGVLGRDPFGEVLDATMRGKTISGRPVVVRRITGEQVKECHILFISSSERRRTREIFGALGSSSVLTVGEHEGFAVNGGMIEFFLEQNKVKFQINIGAVKGAGLKAHPSLLNLAKVVSK